MMLIETDFTKMGKRRGCLLERLRSVELAALFLVMLFTLWVFHGVSQGRAEFRAESAARLGRGEIVNLNAADGAALLKAITPAFASTEEAAQAVQAVEKSGRGFPRVGALVDVRRDDGRTWFPPRRIAQVKPWLVVRSPEQWDDRFWKAGLRFFLSFAVYALITSLAGSRATQWLVPVTAACAGLGIAVQAGLADPLRDTLTFQNLSDKLPVCVALLTIGSLLSVERFGARLGKHYMLAAGILAGLLLAFGKSPLTGVRINLGPLQPGDFIRLLTIAALAAVLGRNWQVVRAAPARLPFGLRLPALTDGVAYFGALMSLVFLACKDQGPALLIALVTLAVYSVAEGAGRVAKGLVAVVALLAVILPWAMPRLFETASGRLTAMLHPTDNNVRGGGHLLEMLFAYGSGAWRGQGFGRGWSHLLPAASTDGVLPAAGESGGFFLVTLILGLLGAIVFFGFRIALRARSEFGFFLVFGVSSLIGLQTVLIAGGTLGVMPLTGVTTPLLSYGGSSQLAVYVAIALMLSVSARAAGPEENAMFAKPQRIVGWMLTAGLAVCAGRAATVAWNADSISGTDGMTHAWNGEGRAPVVNPRLPVLASLVKRGNLVGADGLIFATSDFADMLPFERRYRALGINIQTLRPSGGRYYPAGRIGYSLLGDAGPIFDRYRDDGAAEWVFDRRLRGWGRDDLIYLLRHRRDAADARVERLLHSDRTVKLTVSFAEQYKAGLELERAMRVHHPGKSAVLVGMNPENGDIRVWLQYPFPEPKADSGPLTDLTRRGEFAPGSIEKLVTLMAAMRHRPDALSRAYVCRRVLGGHVGNYLEGARLMVHDDSGNKSPHGNAVDWRDGLRVSCNATFAGIAEQLSAEDFRETCGMFGIRLGDLTDAEKAMVGFGQGPVTIAPSKAMQVAAVAANGGRLVRPRLTPDENIESLQVVPAAFAGEMAAAERSVVMAGTARALRTDPLRIFGKTGTAQWLQKGGQDHAWFIGSTGYGERQHLSFAVLVVRGGHGGSAAAPLAAKVLHQVATVRN